MSTSCCIALLAAEYSSESRTDQLLLVCRPNLKNRQRSYFRKSLSACRPTQAMDFSKADPATHSVPTLVFTSKQSSALGQTRVYGLQKTLSKSSPSRASCNHSLLFSRLGRHVALKILTGHASQLNANRLLRELAVYERLDSLPVDETKYCSRLITHFKHKGIEQDGEHLCLALELERATLASVWNAHNIKFHPIPIVKRIMCHTLHGMAALHKCGIVHTGTSLFCVIRRSSISHTDIKPDNIMVSLGPSWSDETVSAWVQDHPPRVYNSFQSLYKVVTGSFCLRRIPSSYHGRTSSVRFQVI
jgi:serine/threonine protein kinase